MYYNEYNLDSSTFFPPADSSTAVTLLQLHDRDDIGTGSVALNACNNDKFSYKIL